MPSPEKTSIAPDWLGPHDLASRDDRKIGGESSWSSLHEPLPDILKSNGPVDHRPDLNQSIAHAP